MVRSTLSIFILLLVFASALVFSACDGGGDDAAPFSDRGLNPDDDDTGLDDDDTGTDDDDSDDDDTDDDDDDDDSTGPKIQFLLPTEDSTLPDSNVLIHGRFQYLSANDITICEKISETECTDRTNSFIFDSPNADEFVATLPLSDGQHTFEASAETSGKATVTDTVTFTVESGGARITIALDRTNIQAGETVVATVKVFDEDGVDITSGSTIDYYVEPADSFVQNGNEFTFNKGGLFKVTAATTVGSSPVEASAFVFVASAQVASVELLISPNSIAVGETSFISAEVLDENDNIVYEPVYFSASPPFGASFPPENGTTTSIIGTFEQAGAIEITGTVVGTTVKDTVILNVDSGPPVTLNMTIPQPSFTLPQGGQVVVTPVVEIFDAYGNILDYPYALGIFPTGPTINNTNGTVTFDDNQGHSGTYSITASATGVSGVNDSATIYIDTTSQIDIIFTNPPRGLVSGDSDVDVEGYVIDCEVGHYLYINDISVSLNGSCEFTYNVTLLDGLNLIQARLNDGAAGPILATASTSVLKGNYNPDDALIDKAVQIGLTEGGLAKFGDIAEDLVEDMNVPAIIMAMNPVFDEEASFWGVELASAEAEVTDVSLGPLLVNFDVYSGGANYMGTTIRLEHIELSFEVEGQVIGIGYSVSGSVSTAYVQVNAETEINVINDELYTNVDTIDIDIAQIDVDINNFPDDLEDLFESEITDLIESVASDALQSEIPPIIADLVSQIPMDYTFPINLPNGVTTNVNVAMAPDSINTDNTGDAFTFILDAKVVMDRVSQLVPIMPGSLQTAGTPPLPFGAYMAGTSNPYHVAMAMDDDLLNQALYNLYRSGAISLDIDSVFNTSDTGMNLLLPNALTTAYPDNEVNIKFRPQMPPVILIGETTDKVPVPNVLQIGDLLVHCFVEDGSDEVLFLTLAISASVPLEIDVPFPSNTLEVTAGDPEVTIDLIAQPIADFNQAAFETLAPLMIQALLPVITDLLGGIEIPTFSGYGAQVLQLGTTGGSNDHLTIWADMITP